MTLFEQFRKLNLPGRVIAISVAVWVFTQLFRLFSIAFMLGNGRWEDWLALHANLHDFAYTPWTLFSYMWVHANIGDDFFHIIFNMVWLWWFGQFFLRYHSNLQFLGVYLLGGLFAGAFYLLIFNCVPMLHQITYLYGSQLVGASGAIFAIVVATAMRQPDEPIYLNLFVRIVAIRMRWFALIALGINILNLAGGENVGGIICHLGGMLFGCLFGLCERRGIDITQWLSASVNKVAALFRPRPTMTASLGGRHIPNDRRKDHDYNRGQREYQARVDAILDKISKSGYEGLSAEEKAFLFDASQRKSHK